MVIKILIHVQFKKVENYYVARQKTNTKKTTNHSSHFQFHIRRTKQISYWTITTALPRINHFQSYDKNITRDDYQKFTTPIRRKKLEIMETERDF